MDKVVDLSNLKIMKIEDELHELLSEIEEHTTNAIKTLNELEEFNKSSQLYTNVKRYKLRDRFEMITNNIRQVLLRHHIDRASETDDSAKLRFIYQEIKKIEREERKQKLKVLD